MVEILGLTIVRQESEEQFFRRSAEASSGEVARSLFLELADDMRDYVTNLEQRRKKLIEALETLTTSEEK
jgi:hypothetical protein